MRPLANRWRWMLIFSLLVLALAACEAEADSPSGVLASPTPFSNNPPLRIVSGSENETLEPIIQEWAIANGQPVIVDYLGSVDISRLLRAGGGEYDAVWPANSLWLNFGDTQGLVHNTQSIMRSPVVLGVKLSVAESLGWVGADVTINDILEAAESGQLRFMMTSATQSNSGASFYFAALSAFAGSPEVLTMDDLESTEIQEKITRILGSVNRSSGSSGWLASLYLKTSTLYDAMVNYEAVIIETNLALEARGEEPLYAIYPSDGLALADSPLGFIRKSDGSNTAMEQPFLDLQAYLLSPEVQTQLVAQGRRASFIGLQMDSVDSSVFRPEWGIDVERVIQSIRFPTADVIEAALNLYQTAFRKPSCTVIAVDRSGSMTGDGEELSNAGLRTVLNQSIAEQYLLQATAEDQTTIMLFNERVINDYTEPQWTVYGNDPAELNALFLLAEQQRPGGNTNIFGTAEAAVRWLQETRTDRCLPAVILMTDGVDNAGVYANTRRYIQTTENDIPIFVITFGEADRTQVEPLTDLTFGRIFNGSENLVEAFRSAKGYN